MKHSGSKSAKKKDKEPQHIRAGLVILICITSVLALAVALLLVMAIRIHRQSKLDALNSTEENSYDALSPEAPNISDSPPYITEPETTIPPSKEGNQQDYHVPWGEKSNGQEAASQDTDNEAGDTPPNIDDEADETHNGDGKAGEQIFIDDSELRQYAENIYYSVHYFDSGNSCTSGNSAQTPSASVIKVFIMEYAFFQSLDGRLDMEETINGTTIRSLITSMIQISDNDATNMLIDRFGMDALNSFIVGQGYKDTVVGRKMLVFESRGAGRDNYTSLNDCMQFLEKLYSRREEEPYRQMMDIMKGQQIRTKIQLKLPQGAIAASKTGELDDVENDIGIVFTDNSAFAIVVLTNNVWDTGSIRNAIGNFALTAYNMASPEP